MKREGRSGKGTGRVVGEGGSGKDGEGSKSGGEWEKKELEVWEENGWEEGWEERWEKGWEQERRLNLHNYRIPRVPDGKKCQKRVK